MAPPHQEALRLPWGGWAAAGPAQPQPSPLAAMLSQVRVPAPGPGPGQEPPGRRPDELGVYSLFPSAPAPELTARGAAYSLFPSAGMQHVSIAVGSPSIAVADTFDCSVRFYWYLPVVFGSAEQRSSILLAVLAWLRNSLRVSQSFVFVLTYIHVSLA